ncbi:hypothetical protein L6452_17283 [Arctium lappa]|uniref:Uncharacterized protein n=1 Tax=Arctium lappa TaxID=4217 RepID=A0ACB9C2Z4_ARCLA|nr:hypothetical protein L6452_17283 [Arctium lappa]
MRPDSGYQVDREMELVFNTCKCVEGDKVVFALSMLRDNAMFWWEAKTGGEGSKAARGMAWDTFVAKFKTQFCPLAAVKKLEEEFLAKMSKKEKDRQKSERGTEKRKWEGPARDTKKVKTTRPEQQCGSPDHIKMDWPQLKKGATGGFGGK